MSRETVIPASEVRTIAVLGAGTMGRGIAQVAAVAGFHVFLRDIEERFVSAGMDSIRISLDRAVERGKLGREQAGDAASRLMGTTSVSDAVAAADAVIEAVPEDLELKRSIFVEVESASPAGALLATNTSSLRVGSIAEGLLDPGRLVGMHFFNPVPVLKLLEVVEGPASAPEAVATARDLGLRLGKDPIVVRDSPGFASSRLGLVLGLEAMRMLESGVASAEDIDKAMLLGYGHPMGPLKLTDLVGLDVRLAIARYLAQELGAAFSPPRILVELVAAGKLGKKSGEGFYLWDGDTARPKTRT